MKLDKQYIYFGFIAIIMAIFTIIGGTHTILAVSIYINFMILFTLIEIKNGCNNKR